MLSSFILVPDEAMFTNWSGYYWRRWHMGANKTAGEEAR